jgi:hypothetical protein
MPPATLFLGIAGVWVLTQIFAGKALERLRIVGVTGGVTGGGMLDLINPMTITDPVKAGLMTQAQLDELRKTDPGAFNADGTVKPIPVGQ